MDHEIELIRDEDGIALIGDATAIERFLVSEGIPFRDLELTKRLPALSTLGAAVEIGGQVAENAGRWVKLTEESAALKKILTSMAGSSDNVRRAILMDDNKTAKILEYITSPGTLLTNPAVLSGVGGIMSQVAMQQAMDEITDYLAVIDEKVDDVLRAQKDAVFADMIGVDFVIEEAMTVRQEVGRLPEVTWSKVQGTAMTIARTQAYVLRQLDAIAEKLESKRNLGDVADATKLAESKVHEWLTVLAECFRLQDALAILELDRVLDAAPDELDRHRRALRTARQNRLSLIGRSTERLMGRMDAAAGTANSKVLLHPIDARAVVRATNKVASGVVAFHEGLGIDDGRETVQARRWLTAVGDVRDDILEAGAGGLDAAGRLGTEAARRAKLVADQVSSTIAARRREADDVD